MLEKLKALSEKLNQAKVYVVRQDDVQEDTCTLVYQFKEPISLTDEECQMLDLIIRNYEWWNITVLDEDDEAETIEMDNISKVDFSDAQYRDAKTYDRVTHISFEIEFKDDYVNDEE